MILQWWADLGGFGPVADCSKLRVLFLDREEERRR
jgi:hypothetical protein